MKRESSTAAHAAKEIRILLKSKYPATKFKITSQRYAGGSSINISWSDGPKQSEIRNLVDKYSDSTFDAMTDSTVYKNRNFDGPQVSHIFYRREK